MIAMLTHVMLLKDSMDVDTGTRTSEARLCCALRLRALEAELAAHKSTLAASREREAEALKLVAASQAAVVKCQEQEWMIRDLGVVRDHLADQLRDQQKRASDMMFKYAEMDDKVPLLSLLSFIFPPPSFTLLTLIFDPPLINSPLMYASTLLSCDPQLEGMAWSSYFHEASKDGSQPCTDAE